MFIKQQYANKCHMKNVFVFTNIHKKRSNIYLKTNSSFKSQKFHNNLDSTHK